MSLVDKSGESFFKVGDSFGNFNELQKRIEEYQNNFKVLLYIRDSATVGSKKVKRSLNENLKYYYVQYACTHGGRKFKSKSQGKRTSS